MEMVTSRLVQDTFTGQAVRHLSFPGSLLPQTRLIRKVFPDVQMKFSILQFLPVFLTELFSTAGCDSFSAFAVHSVTSE